MEKKFRNQLLTESKKREEEIENVNLEIEEREASENGPFVLIRNKKNKWVITTCGALVNGKEFDTKEDAEEHLAQKKVGGHPNSNAHILHTRKKPNGKHSKRISHEKNIGRRQTPKRKQNGSISA